MLIAVAEEFLEKARGAAHDVAMSLDPEQVEEYQKLISVSIGCLETVLHSGRLTPRQEAKLRLRYATVLHEETDNVMECETALTKGIALCDNVCSTPGSSLPFCIILTITPQASPARSQILLTIPATEGAFPKKQESSPQSPR